MLKKGMQFASLFSNLLWINIEYMKKYGTIYLRVICLF